MNFGNGRMFPSASKAVCTAAAGICSASQACGSCSCLATMTSVVHNNVSLILSVTVSSVLSVWNFYTASASTMEWGSSTPLTLPRARNSPYVLLLFSISLRNFKITSHKIFDQSIPTLWEGSYCTTHLKHFSICLVYACLVPQKIHVLPLFHDLYPLARGKEETRCL